MLKSFVEDKQCLGTIQKAGLVLLDSSNQFNTSNVKRIHFETTHLNSFKEKNLYWFFDLPFPETVKKIFEKSIPSLKFTDNSPSGIALRISKTDDYHIQRVKDWISEQGSRVFLKDELDLSIALDMRAKSNNENDRTEIGELFYKAKYHASSSSIGELINICEKGILSLPFYKEADYILSVPLSKPDKFCLPSEIVRRLSEKLNIQNLSPNLIYKYPEKKEELKNVKTEAEKKEILRSAEPTYDGIDLSRKKIILFDDLYESGITINFMANVLRKSSAHGDVQIYGLCLVKALKNT